MILSENRLPVFGIMRATLNVSRKMGKIVAPGNGGRRSYQHHLAGHCGAEESIGAKLAPIQA
jgi:hypothetical protein